VEKRTDSELVEAARGGDRGAFDQLVRQYQPLALRAAMGMAPNEEAARDLVQEALLQAYLSLRHLRDAARFRSWLLGIVRNVCRSYFRGQKSDWLSLEALTGGMVAEAPWLSDASPDPHAAAVEREQRQAIAEAMGALSPMDRAIARLFYEEQHALKEIAATLDISVPAVKNRLYRARKQLQETLLAGASEDRSLPHRLGRNRMTRVNIDAIEEEDRIGGRATTVRLRDETGRTLRIAMGPGDAGAVDLGLRDLALPRPMASQFMADLLAATGARLEEVRIDSLREGVLYAKARVRRGKTVRELDARPSDALALALRAGSPILVADEIMERAGNDAPARNQGPSNDAPEASIPERLPVLPVRDGVFFPRTLFPIFVGREASIRALEAAKAEGHHVLLLAQRSANVDTPRPQEIYEIGTVGKLMQVLWLPGNTMRVMIEGKARARVLEYLQTDPFHCARVELLPEPVTADASVDALISQVLSRYRELASQAKTIGFAPPAPDGLDAGRLADTIAAGSALPVEVRQQLLETLDPRERLEKLSSFLG
jgi:RNA polymerase sigma factor (sigma-70 family)